MSESDACRTIFSMLVNQCKANLDLEQQLKYLQSTNKFASPDDQRTHSYRRSTVVRSTSTRSLRLVCRFVVFVLDRLLERFVDRWQQQHDRLRVQLAFEQFVVGEKQNVADLVQAHHAR